MVPELHSGSMNLDPVIATIIRFALGWLFLAAAAHKLQRHGRLPVGARNVSHSAGSDWSRLRRGWSSSRKSASVSACCGSVAPAFIGGACAAASLRRRDGDQSDARPALHRLRLRRRDATVVDRTRAAQRRAGDRRASPRSCRRRRVRSAGSTSSAWRRVCSCSERCMRRPINCSRRVHVSRSGCDGRADRFEHRAVDAGDRTRVRRVRADAPDRRAARTRLARRCVDVVGRREVRRNAAGARR